MGLSPAANALRLAIKQKIKDDVDFHKHIIKIADAVCISDLMADVRLAGMNSFLYYQKTNTGQKQCANTIEAATRGMSGEAVVERWLADNGFRVIANWHEWKTGYADDTKADIHAFNYDNILIIETKTTVRQSDPKTQITIQHGLKYQNEGAYVVCVFFDEQTDTGYVYCLASADAVVKANRREDNLYGKECFSCLPVNLMKLNYQYKGMLL